MPCSPLPCPLQDFFEDIFEELAKYGEIEHLNVCDNLADHMVRGVGLGVGRGGGGARGQRGSLKRKGAGWCQLGMHVCSANLTGPALTEWLPLPPPTPTPPPSQVGNVYVKFRDEECAARALQGLQGRYYAGKPIQVEFSPVTDFRESTCRWGEGGAPRGRVCGGGVGGGGGFRR